MANGTKKSIEDIVVGDIVLAWNGKQSVPTKVIDIPYDDYNETIKIITSSGVEVAGDKNHYFPICWESNGVDKIEKITINEIENGKHKRQRFVRGFGRKTPRYKITRKPRRDDLKIKSIIHVGIKRCRCLTVEHKSHTFILANGIVSGNSGKTEKGAEYCIRMGIEKPNMRIWVVAKNFSDSVNVQQRKIWKLLPKDAIKYGDYSEVNGFTNKKLILKNKTVFIFKSYDQKREAFQSDDVDLIWNDEETPYDIYREERMRLIDRDGEMIFTMTSKKGITQLLEEIFDGHEVVNTRYAPLLKAHIPVVIGKNGMNFYMLWTTDNPHVNNARALEEAKLMNREEIMSCIYGLPVNLKGRVYPKFSKDIHVIPMSDVPFSDCSFATVMDPHDRKPYAIIWAAINSIGNIYIFHESPFEKDFNDMAYGDKTYDEYASEIKEVDMQVKKFGGIGFFDRIIDPNYGNSTIKLAERQGGQSRTTVRKEFAKRGLRFRDGIDLREEGHLKVREYLHYEEKYNEEGVREIIVHPKLFVVDVCTNTINHMSKYAHKDPETPGGDTKNVVGLIEKYKDFCDTVRYLCMSNPRKRVHKLFEPATRKAY